MNKYIQPLPVVPASPVHAPGIERVGAGFWRRLAGYLIDGFVVGVGSVMLTVLLQIVSGGAMGGLANLGSFLLALAYFPFMESSDWQATLGKRTLGMRVVDDEGQQLSLLHAVGRYVAAALNWITLGVGYIMVGVREDKRGLHDLLAHTQVVLDDPSQPETPMLAWIIIGIWAVLSVLVVIALLVLAAALAGAH